MKEVLELIESTKYQKLILNFINNFNLFLNKLIDI